MHVFKGHREGARSLAAHDNNLLVVFADIGLVRIWNTDTGDCIQERGIGGRVLCPLPLGHLLASHSPGNILRQWTTHNLLRNPYEGALHVETEIKCEHEICTIALSSQGKLAFGVGEGTYSLVEIWDSSNKKHIRSLQLGDDDQRRSITTANMIQEVGWLADEQLVVVGLEGKIVRYAGDTGKIIQEIRGRQCLPSALRYKGIACVGNSLIINSGRGGLTIFDRDVDISH